MWGCVYSGSIVIGAGATPEDLFSVASAKPLGAFNRITAVISFVEQMFTMC